MRHVDLVLLILRVGLGVTVFLHGANKVRNGIAGTAGWFDSMGMRPGRLNAAAAAGTEMGGGIAFALGLFTPFAAAALIGLMTVAGVVAHRNNGFFIFNPGEGWEYVFVIGIAALAVGGIGPGAWSADNLLGVIDGGYIDGWWGALVAAGVGVGVAAAMLAAFWRPPRPAENRAG